jgi:hypothetical protein
MENVERSALRQWRAGWAWAVAALVALVLTSACDSAPTSTPGAQIDLALATSAGPLASGKVTWAVLSANGSVLSSGTADLSDPNALPSVLVSIPTGKGERISVEVTLGDGTPCSGTSAPFSVSGGQRVTVDVNLSCDGGGTGGALGSVLISTSLTPGDNCPVLTNWSSSLPSGAAAAAASASLSVSATDGDTKDHLSYAWTATSGTFNDAAAPNTTYSCQLSGTQTVTVTIADDHWPQACSSSIRFPPIVCP